jgi:hypothetical protein
MFDLAKMRGAQLVKESMPGARAVAGREWPRNRLSEAFRPIPSGRCNVFWCVFFRLSSSAAKAGDCLKQALPGG